MIREQRRYRHPAEIPPPSRLARAKAEGYGDQHQRGGMAVLFRASLPERRCLHSEFQAAGSPTLQPKYRSPGWLNLAAPACASQTCPKESREQLDRWRPEAGEKIDDAPLNDRVGRTLQSAALILLLICPNPSLTATLSRRLRTALPPHRTHFGTCAFPPCPSRWKEITSSAGLMLSFM